MTFEDFMDRQGNDLLSRNEFAARAFQAGAASRDAEVADLRDDRDTWKARAEFSFRERDKLSQQLAAQAAQIEMLRDGLKRADDLLRTSYDHISPLIREALAIQPDDSALKAWLGEPVATVRAESLNNLCCLVNPLPNGTCLYAPKGLK